MQINNNVMRFNNNTSVAELIDGLIDLSSNTNIIDFQARLSHLEALITTRIEARELQPIQYQATLKIAIVCHKALLHKEKNLAVTVNGRTIRVNRFLFSCLGPHFAALVGVRQNGLTAVEFNEFTYKQMKDLCAFLDGKDLALPISIEELEHLLGVATIGERYGIPGLGDACDSAIFAGINLPQQPKRVRLGLSFRIAKAIICGQSPITNLENRMDLINRVMTLHLPKVQTSIVRIAFPQVAFDPTRRHIMDHSLNSRFGGLSKHYRQKLDQEGLKFTDWRDLASKLVTCRDSLDGEAQTDWDAGKWIANKLFVNVLTQRQGDLFDLFLFVVANRDCYGTIMPALLRGLCQSYIAGQLKEEDAEWVLHIASNDEMLSSILEENQVVFALSDEGDSALMAPTYSRFILQLRSELLVNIFIDYQEDSLGSADHPVCLAKVTHQQLQVAYSWMKGKIDLKSLSWEETLSLTDTLDYLGCKNLEKHLAGSVDESSLLKFLTLADRYHLPAVTEACLNLMSEKYKNVISIKLMSDGRYRLVELGSGRTANHPELQELLEFFHNRCQETLLKCDGRDSCSSLHRKSHNWKECLHFAAFHPLAFTIFKGAGAIYAAVKGSGLISYVDVNEMIDCGVQVIPSTVATAILSSIAESVATIDMTVPFGFCAGVAAWKALHILKPIHRKIGLLSHKYLLCPHGPLIIDLEAMGGVNPPIIGTLSACKSQLTISASQCSRLMDCDIYKLVLQYRDITELKLKGCCPRVTSQGWLMLSYLKSLEKFALAFSQAHFKFEGLKLSVLAREWPELKEIEISFPYLYSELSPRVLNFLRNCPDNVDVNIFLKYASCRSIKFIIQACPALTSLQTPGSFNEIDSETATVLARSCPKLRSLNFFRMTADSLVTIARGCPELGILKLSVTDLLPETCAQLVSYCGNLEELHLLHDVIGNVEWIRDDALQSLATLPKLKRLEIVGGSITDQGLEPLLNSNIEWISLITCPRVSSGMLRRLAHRMYTADSCDLLDCIWQDKQLYILKEMLNKCSDINIFQIIDMLAFNSGCVCHYAFPDIPPALVEIRRRLAECLEIPREVNLNIDPGMIATLAQFKSLQNEVFLVERRLLRDSPRLFSSSWGTLIWQVVKNINGWMSLIDAKSLRSLYSVYLGICKSKLRMDQVDEAYEMVKSDLSGWLHDSDRLQKLSDGLLVNWMKLHPRNAEEFDTFDFTPQDIFEAQHILTNCLRKLSEFMRAGELNPEDRMRLLLGVLGNCLIEMVPELWSQLIQLLSTVDA